MGVPDRGQERGVGTLYAAAGGGRVAVLRAEVSEAETAQRQPDVPRHGVRLAPAVREASPAHLDGPAGTVVPELEVHDTGDGVGAVLGRSPVAQHLDLAEGDGRNAGQVRPLGAVGVAVSDPEDGRRPVSPLAVDQHEGVVGRQSPQIGGSDDLGRVTGGLRVDVEGGHDGPQQIGHIGLALFDDVGRWNGVDGDHGLGDGPGTGPASHGHDALEGDHGLPQRHVETGRLAVDDDHIAALCGIADKADLHPAGPGRNAGDRGTAIRVGDVASPQLGQEDLDAGQRLPGRTVAHVDL